MPFDPTQLDEQLRGFQPTAPVVPQSGETTPATSPARGPEPDQTPFEAQAGTSEVYYDHYRNTYWTTNNREGWIQVNEASVRRLAKCAGISPIPPAAGLPSEMDEWFLKVQRDNDVSYAGPLAGYQAGAHTMGEHRILVTQSPRLIVPAPVEWPVLKAILDGQFQHEHCDQQVYLFGWLKYAIEALRLGVLRPGQALVLAGVRDACKSLLQNVITELLGGRAAKPYQFMTGGTPFNSDLFGAEHLMVEDEVASTDLRARRHFGAHIKGVTVNVVQRMHEKYRPAISLKPFWRLSISVNEEPEHLLVLPPLDDSLKDKLLLLKAAPPVLPMPTESPEERTAFWNALMAELPGFLHFLNQWTVPQELRCRRFGIRAFHHPEIVRAINELAPEERLLKLIEAVIFKSPRTRQWEGTAEKLERKLRDEHSQYAVEAGRLLSFSTACGVYLARLATRYPDRVSERRVQGTRLWTVKDSPNRLEVEAAISGVDDDDF